MRSDKVKSQKVAGYRTATFPVVAAGYGETEALPEFQER